MDAYWRWFLTTDLLPEKQRNYNYNYLSFQDKEQGDKNMTFWKWHVTIIKCKLCQFSNILWRKESVKLCKNKLWWKKAKWWTKLTKTEECTKLNKQFHWNGVFKCSKSVSFSLLNVLLLKCHVLISLLFILKCFSKSLVIRTVIIVNWWKMILPRLLHLSTTKLISPAIHGFHICFEREVTTCT